MIYELLRGALLDLLKAPKEPPEPPAGSPGSTRIFRASKRFLTLRLLLWGLGLVLVLGPQLLVLGLMVLLGETPLGAVIAFALVPLFSGALMLMSYFLIRLDWEMRYYIVTDRSLRVRHGAMRIEEHTYTFANIQNLTIHQGPLERALGIANLRVQTAGGGGAPAQAGPAGAGGMMHGGALRGIDDAEQVRDQILSLLRAYRDAGLGDDRPSPPRAAPGAALSVEALERLREIRDDLRALGPQIG